MKHPLLGGIPEFYIQRIVFLVFMEYPFSPFFSIPFMRPARLFVSITDTPLQTPIYP
jgi:hypothetical protein